MIKLLAVLGLGAITLWVAIPTGLALKLDPLITGVTAATGAILGVIVIMTLGEHVKLLILHRYGERSKEKYHGRIYNMLSRQGVAVFGLLSPLLVGAPVGTAVGMALGLPNRRMLFWMSLSICILSIGSAFAITLGIINIEALWHIG